MTKQEFMTTTPKTATDAVAIQILASYSKTSIKELKRATNGLLSKLYRPEDRKLPLEEVVKAVEKAMFFEE